MTAKEKIPHIIKTLKDSYPDALCQLRYEKDYELLFAVRLSAQCTDERVNMVAPVLFAAYPSLEALAGADTEDLERIVHSCGFYRARRGTYKPLRLCCSSRTAERCRIRWRSF